MYIKFFGPPAIQDHDEMSHPLRSAKSAALLAYLICNPQSHKREHLAAFFWPNLELSKARAELRRVLHTLAEPLGKNIQSNRSHVQFLFSDDIEVDAITFESLIKQHANVNQVERAIGLVTGDFLDGYQAPPNSAFAAWLEAEYVRVKEKMIQGLLIIVRHNIGNRDAAAGLDYAHRLLDLQPFSEEAHRAMMQLLAYGDQYRAALAQYEKCAQLLADEFGTAPSPQTVALYERIKGATRPRPHNIQPALTPFIGRKSELTAIWQKVSDPISRLITITGIGGVGKTRVALEIAQDGIYDKTGLFRDGVYIIQLEAAKTSKQVANAIADGLNLSVVSNIPLKQVITDYLKSRHVLLLLDNFEHVIDSEQLIADLIIQCPSLTILVTSRQRLNIHGEQVFELAGLSFPPDIDRTFDPTEYDSLLLFEKCSQQVHPSFLISADNQRQLAEICALVHGMPLGLELAARWSGTIPLNEIAQKLQENIDFLNNSQHNIPERHRSLRAVFNYSLARLSTSQKEALSRLSIFAGEFDYDTAEEVTDTSLLTLVNLLDQSLLRRDTNSERFTMHPRLRQLVRELLDAEPLIKQFISKRYTTYFLNFIAQKENALKGKHQLQAYSDIAQEETNIINAFEVACSLGQFNLMNKAINALSIFLDTRARYTTSIELMNYLADAVDSDEHPLLAGKIATNLSWFYMRSGQYGKAEKIGRKSVSILQSQNTPVPLASAEFVLGSNYLWMGRYQEALALFGPSLEKFEANNDHWGIALLNLLHAQSNDLGSNFDAAQHYAEKSLQIYQTSKDVRGSATALWTLGRIARKQNNLPDALQYFTHGKAFQEEIGDLRYVAMSLCQMGAVVRQMNDSKQAAAYLFRAFQVANYINASQVLIEVILETALFLSEQGKDETALTYAFLVTYSDFASQFMKMQAQAFIDHKKAQLKPMQYVSAELSADSGHFKDHVAEAMAILQTFTTTIHTA